MTKRSRKNSEILATKIDQDPCTICKALVSRGIAVKDSFKVRKFLSHLLTAKYNPHYTPEQKQRVVEVACYIENLLDDNNENINEQELQKIDQMLDQVRHLPCLDRSSALQTEVSALQKQVVQVLQAINYSIDQLPQKFPGYIDKLKQQLEAGELEAAIQFLGLIHKRENDFLKEENKSLKKRTEEMAELLKIDHQTGMRTRVELEQYLQAKIEAHQTENFPIWVLMVAIDGLEDLDNVTGDHLLQDFSRSVIRGLGDFAARYHGKQMAIVLDCASRSTVLIGIDHLKKNLDEFNQQNKSATTMSIGVANLNNVEDDSDHPADQLNGLASDMLKAVARSGGDNVFFAE